MNRITAFLLLSTIISVNCSAVENPVNTESWHKSVIYQTSVQDTANRHICNGVVVAKNWILTLAQCVTNYNANELKVFYGSNRLNEDGMYVNVEEIHINPGFNKTIIKSDMALLLTANNMEIIANVSGPINLPGQDVPVNQIFTSSGWKPPVNGNDLVQLCNATVITLAECKASNPSLGHILRPWLICSVEPINRENICAGVLGSALVTNDNILYGIMSMNDDTAVNKTLNIYTNVFDQIPWIRFTIYGWP